MKAFVVVGPESSGNRFMVRLLIEAGCNGISGHKQSMDGPESSVIFPKEAYLPIALHRSIPHGNYRPALPSIINAAQESGFDVTFLVMIREEYANILSQISQHHVNTLREAQDNYKSAYLDIFQCIIEKRVDFILVPYSSLGRQNFVNWLMEQLQLNNYQSLYKLFVDGDGKYHPVHSMPAGMVKPGFMQKPTSQS